MKKDNFATFSTGGSTTRHTNKEIVVQAPSKATGDIKDLPNPQGLAKASPVFKKIDPEILSEEDKKKAIAKNKKVLKQSDPENPDKGDVEKVDNNG